MLLIQMKIMLDFGAKLGKFTPRVLANLSEVTNMRVSLSVSD